jgi:hypothetical protein
MAGTHRNHAAAHGVGAALLGSVECDFPSLVLYPNSGPGTYAKAPFPP